jgi:hypothetical protein
MLDTGPTLEKVIAGSAGCVAIPAEAVVAEPTGLVSCNAKRLRAEQRTSRETNDLIGVFRGD